MNIALRSVATLITVALLGILFTLPVPVLAVGTAGDAICVASNCTIVKSGPNDPRPICAMVSCPDITNGFSTSAKCVSPISCKAIGTSGKDGFGLDKIAGILGQLMGQLMKGSPSSPTAPPPTSPTGTGTCASTYIVRVVTSDPCAIYVPNVLDGATTSPDGSNNVTKSLLDALNGGIDWTDTTTTDTTGSSTTEILNQFSTDGDTTGSKAVIVSQTSSTTINPVAGNVFGQSVNLLPGLKGDISVLSNGATFIVGNRDQANNTEVAGFYGGDATIGQSTGLVASWCQSRPWQTNFLSKIISPTFFDGLCSVRGYKVGSTPTTPSSGGQSQVTITQSPAQPVKAVATTTVKSANSLPPTVDIWASPATVSLGARTSIFWTSSNAVSCQVTSPDGSFSQRTLTGGASTVAITSATVYTISCLNADDLHATKNVTVQLAI